MSRRLLEVIALGPADAEAAQAGGADRLELVAEMAADGLSPSPSVAAAVVAATDLPVRAMLRTTPDFVAADLDGLADGLLETGVEGLVFGFLDECGEVDTDACERIAARLCGRPWTFHRAIDHARDPVRAWKTAIGLSGVDAVLTAGSAAGIADGLPVLASRTPPQRILAGGGLTPSLIPPLVDAGITSFHIGRTARRGGSWEEPVSANAVAQWRQRLDLT